MDFIIFHTCDNLFIEMASLYYVTLSCDRSKDLDPREQKDHATDWRLFRNIAIYL